jgi:hypothetical protein
LAVGRADATIRPDFGRKMRVAAVKIKPAPAVPTARKSG